jgi:hypothetical protein
MAQNPPPQYGLRSPDGRHWWDGTAWQPVPETQWAAEQQARSQWQAQPGVPPSGALGNTRSVGISILLAIVTLGIYTYFWTYWTQDEIKRHSGFGVGGGLGLLIYFFLHPVTYFLIAADVAEMHRARGWNPPVTAITGLWVLLPLVGSIVWFVKVQNALNAYWTALGAPPP